MKKNFTKQDLRTGDIIEDRSGERGVVILERNCIIYQAGGLDELDVFTDDLLVDSADRSGDIVKVCRDDEGPIGFKKLYDAYPVFRRINNKAEKEREAELNDKYDLKKGRVTAVVLVPHFRRCEKIYLKNRDSVRNISDKRPNIQPVSVIDLAISEAPSMTICGGIKLDKTFIPVPGTDNLFVIYNKYQEEWHNNNYEKSAERGFEKDNEPVIVIPEREISIHSKCMIARITESGEIENILDEDIEKVKDYMVRMQLPVTE